ncbi:glycine hydroxymethyltransferase, partial [Streptomyces sp. SID11233]|nr:glycine hydroxymethyltransferase [Streptomyces sp. SID11233]
GIRLGTPALTTRGLGTPELDEVAALIEGVLRGTRPGATKSGKPSKAQYVIEDGLAARTAEQAADLLAKHPLYP